MDGAGRAVTRTAARGVVLLVAGLVAGLLIGAAPAGTQPAGAQPAGAPETERTESYDVRIEVRRDGSIHVQELIAYQVGGPEERHGIFRYIPVRSRKDFFHDRMQPLRNLSVRAGPGTPTAREDQ